MLPVIIFAAVAVPLLLVGLMVRQRRAAGQAAGGPVDAAVEEEYEREFADAEAYQQQWREEQHRQHPDDRLY